MVIAGDRDVEEGAVSFRYRDGRQDNGVPVDEAVERITRAVEAREQV
jgi:threonyl-tRNA synthetase